MLRNFTHPFKWAIVILAALAINSGVQAQMPGWNHAVPVWIHEQGGVNQFDIQVELRYDTQTPVAAGEMDSLGHDIRFARNCDGSQPLDFLVGGHFNTDSTRLYVDIDTLLANDSIKFYMIYGNDTASSAGDPSIFNGPHSSTDSVIPSSTNNVVSNSSRGFIFQPNVDIMVLHFGKREPTGTQRYVTLWDVASQTIIHQDSVTGGVGVWNYKQLQEPIFLTQGTSYILTLFQGQGDGYYFGTSTQIGQHLTYGGSMRYCNNCTENTYPTQTLNNYHYGTPDFWYYLPNFASVAPTYTWGTELEADAGADDNLCGAQTINLSGQIAGGIGGTTTTWSPGTSVSDSTILNPTATISTATAFALTVVDGDGCTDTDSVFYTVIAAPTADLGNDSTVCGGNIMLDAGAGNYSYMWSTGDTSQMITASMTGNYGVTITDNSTGCTATDDVNLNFGGNVSVSLGADTTLCDGNTLTLDAGAGYSAYNWSNAGTNQTITIAIGGSYSVIVTDSSGCTASDTIDVVVVQSPTVTLPADTVICPDDSIMLSAPAGFTYMWSTGGTGMTELVTMAGTYGVTITDQNGCTDNDEIVIDTCTLIGVANAFALANNMDVLPNPYNGEAKIVLRLTSATSGTIMLHDLSGRVVWSVEPREYGAGEHTLDLSTTELANGTYYLRFNAQDGMLAKRVVLAR